MTSSFAWYKGKVVTRTWAIAVALVCLAQLSSRPCSAQVAAYLTIDGDVQTTIALSEAEFKALPRSDVIVKDEGGKDQRFEGVDLALVLLSAGTPLKSDLKGADVAKYLHAEGADGFAAVFALPEFDQQAFLIADTLDGAPLGAANGPLQMISPNEARHSRWVKHLMLLRIKRTQK